MFIPILYLSGIHICALNAGDNPDNDGCAPVPPSTNVDLGFMASNSVDVDIADDEETYGTTRAIDSDDDRPVAALSEQEMELIRRLCLIMIHWFMNSTTLVILNMLMEKKEMMSC